MRSQDVTIPIDHAVLPGELRHPDGADALIIFAHGSGSSRRSPRNQSVATTLNDAGFATLLFDLLTGRESENRANVFDIALLADRLNHAAAWARSEDRGAWTTIGYFGASTGAAAALVAAAQDQRIGAIVSRGGRPDLAGESLHQVTAPTLLIVGGEDQGVIELNQNAFAQLRCAKELSIVLGATHLFEELGTLEEVARLAAKWFRNHLA